MPDDPRLFEQEVRRIARLRWPQAEFGGTELIEARERDGVFITDDCVHLIECTTSRELRKAQTDLDKLHKLYKHMQSSHVERAFKCWFVTLHEPTAEQRKARSDVKNAPPNLFNIVSYSQFLAKLVDSHEYLSCRETHKFGSVFDPRTGGPSDNTKYVAVGLRVIGESQPWDISTISSELLKGSRFTILGEYGVGKSMTLRELFRQLTSAHRNSSNLKFPLYLNLREHQGQKEPAEILERHARNIGFQNPSQLVRAWKAGFVILLIDGFDEVSSLGLQGAWKRLRDARRTSMAGIRQLIADSPSDCGIAIAGRDNFFNTADERRDALGQSMEWKDVRLDEFGEDQIKELAEQLGVVGTIPGWVPSRPLLLTTLFSRRTNAGSAAYSDLEDPAAGWDLLLTEVCDREARIESGVSGSNVRSILESLATLARSKYGGLGPLATNDIVQFFTSECGFEPTDEALIVLQRLPGLARDSGTDDDSRTFVDEEFADACRAGDLIRFCKEPFTFDGRERLRTASIAAGTTAIGIVSRALNAIEFSEGHLTAAIRAIDKLGREGATGADLVNIALRRGIRLTSPVFISDLQILSMEIEQGRQDLSLVTYNGCYITFLEIVDGVGADDCPGFQECLIQELCGRVSSSDLPPGRFSNSIVESFSSSVGTTSSMLDLELPPGAAVLITLLKKLFVQSLSGRKESALYRGLDAQLQRKVPPLLELLKNNSLIEALPKKSEPVWLPIRRNRARVLSILNSPSSSGDQLMIAARRI